MNTKDEANAGLHFRPLLESKKSFGNMTSLTLVLDLIGSSSLKNQTLANNMLNRIFCSYIRKKKVRILVRVIKRAIRVDGPPKCPIVILKLLLSLCHDSTHLFLFP